MAGTEASVGAPRRRERAAANEPAARPSGRRRRSLSELAFPGCDRIPMSLAEYRVFDGRLELWDAETRTAWMAREGPIWEHEGPSRNLGEMAALIAAVRGSPIKCYGPMGLVRRHEVGRRRRILHPDQTVYLHPWLVEQEVGDRLLVVGAGTAGDGPIASGPATSNGPGTGPNHSTRPEVPGRVAPLPPE